MIFSNQKICKSHIPILSYSEKRRVCWVLDFHFLSWNRGTAVSTLGIKHKLVMATKIGGRCNFFLKPSIHTSDVKNWFAQKKLENIGSERFLWI